MSAKERPALPKVTLAATLGQMAPPKSGRDQGMPPDPGGILRGYPLLGGAICPHVVSRRATRRAWAAVERMHMKKLMIYEIGPMKVTKQNELY